MTVILQSEWDDDKSRMLLTMLHEYVKCFEPDLPLQVEHLAEDLAQSMDETTNRDDEMYRFIAKAYHWDRVATAPQDKHDPNSPGEGIRRGGYLGDAID